MVPDEPLPDILERLERAEQLKLNGSHHDALAILEELLLEDPENVSALEEIADNELSLGEYERAEAAAQQAIKLDECSYTGFYIVGFLRSRTEQWPEAITHLRRSNSLKPNNAEILRCLGWALFNGGQRAQGIVTLERALNLDIESSLTLCDLGVAYLQIQNFAKAKTLFARALDLDPDNARAAECIQAVDRLSRLSLGVEDAEKMER
jgi:Flp pilus assembly protein TadD